MIIFYPLFCLIWQLAVDKISLREDAKNWCKFKRKPYSIYSVFRILITDKAFRNQFYYRVGPLRNLLSHLLPGYDHLQITTPSESVGGGLLFQHGFSTIVSAEKIGINCKIYQQVTIGYNHKLRAPIIGNNVEICCGAKIFGGITIGNNVLIGANSVVINNVPDNSIVAGAPARIIGELSPNSNIFNRNK